MSLAIVFKGAEGIVLAADSRVTLTVETQQPNGKAMLLPSTFDNATKLFPVATQKFVGVVTYGAGAFGSPQQRTAHSYLPEFEEELNKNEEGRLSVKTFSDQLSNFYMNQWSSSMPEDYDGSPLVFLVGGYDEGAPYGSLFQIDIPTKPEPRQWHEGGGAFGPVWGGQMELTSRLIHGFDPEVPKLVQQILDLSDEGMEGFDDKLKEKTRIQIPYQFLPLQDCVDFSISLIQITRTLQSFYIGIRGVGGAIDVATITRTDGFTPIQQKKITGKHEI